MTTVAAGPALAGRGWFLRPHDVDVVGSHLRERGVAATDPIETTPTATVTANGSACLGDVGFGDDRPGGQTVLMSRQLVVSAERAAEALALLKPAFAVPIHYAFTGGPVMDRIALKYDGTPTRFAYAASSRASLTKVPQLEPDQKLTI